MSVFPRSPVFLSKKDFTLFYQLFCLEINRLLPVSATVLFWDKQGDWLSPDRAEKILGREWKKIADLCSSPEPAVINNALVIPLPVEEDEYVGVVAGGIDSALLEKMAPEWLEELCDTLLQALIETKEKYLYPETGLYSSRLLGLLMSGEREAAGAFFLVGVPGFTRRPTRGLVKIKQAAYLLEATTRLPVLYFGGNVFGIYHENMSRENGLKFARFLLSRLKREGVQRVHIGMTIIGETNGKSPDMVLDESWQALETAEQRGPCSLCEASTLHNRQNHPFASPGRTISGKLQSRWRGLKRFSLLLIRAETAGDKEAERRVPLAQRINACYGERYYCVPVNADQCYLLLPGFIPKKALSEAEKIKAELDKFMHPLKVAVGLSYWPCGDFFRTTTLVNCRKALMHGDFFGPGSVTLFDHVSLNVSGDYFFDEGDYRQAVRDYRHGLKMHPGETNLLNSLGVALTELNRLKEAVRYFDLVLEKEAGNFMALVNRGFALRMLKHYDEALASLSEAKKCKEFSRSPVAADISLQLGKLHCERGQHKQAIHILEQMLIRNGEKGGYPLYSLLGSAYASNRQNGKAIQMLQEAIRCNPHDAEALSTLGELYGIEGQGDEIALAFCTQAVNIDGQSWKNWLRLAKVRMRVADHDGAQEAVRESLLRNRKAVDSLFLSGILSSQQGDRKRAKKIYQKVLRMAPDFADAARELQKLS